MKTGFGSAVRKKAKKSYAARGVALTIGITEVDQRGDTRVDLRQVAGELLAETDYGAILLFSESMNLDYHPWRLEPAYRRVVHWDAGRQLIELLDRVWPHRDHQIDRWAVPVGAGDR